MPNITADTHPRLVLPRALEGYYCLLRFNTNWQSKEKRRARRDLHTAQRKGLRGSPNPASSSKAVICKEQAGRSTREEHTDIEDSPACVRACVTAHARVSAPPATRGARSARSEAAIQRLSSGASLAPPSGNCGAWPRRGPPPGGDHPTTRGLWKDWEGGRRGRGGGAEGRSSTLAPRPLPPGSTGPR